MDSRKRGHKSSRNMQTGYISRSHLFHVSLAFISLEHQLESACKCYTCQAKRLALPAGPLFMDETSPRARRNASRSPECSLSSATRNTIVLLPGHSLVSDRPYFSSSSQRDSIEFQNPRVLAVERLLRGTLRDLRVLERI